MKKVLLCFTHTTFHPGSTFRQEDIIILVIYHIKHVVEII